MDFLEKTDTCGGVRHNIVVGCDVRQGKDGLRVGLAGMFRSRRSRKRKRKRKEKIVHFSPQLIFRIFGFITKCFACGTDQLEH
jgi:hypothetical protein